jgi:short-subunit dehydrogenase
VKIIRGKKALVTGAASGIGRAIAIALAEEGADLYLIDIDEVNLQDAAREAKSHGVEVITSLCDLSDSAKVSAVVRKLLSTWDRLNILVNNAGLLYYGQTLGMTGEQWNRLMAVNLLAPIQLVRELLPTLLKTKEAHILNICSILGLVTWRKVTAYQTSKHGLVGFTAGLRSEYGARLGVTGMCPGLVSTPMIERLESTPIDGNGGPRERPFLPPRWIFTNPEKVAAESIAAIRKNRSLVVVSPAARLIWWLERLIPGGVSWILQSVAR